MMNSQDIARMFVLLTTLQYPTTQQVRNNAQYLLKFFPDYSEEELCSESQRLIKPLIDIDLQKKYGDLFRSLSIEQRYSICIEIPVYFHCEKNLFARWLDIYKNAKDKWFAAEEITKVKESIKETIDYIREQTREKLRCEYSAWAEWDTAKEMLYIVSSWKAENHGATALYQITNHMAGHHHVFLKAPDSQHMHYVTGEDCLCWGKHNSVIWAEAVTNGRFLRHNDGTISQSVIKGQVDTQLMPAILKDQPQSKWDTQVYKYDQELEKWARQMLGVCSIENDTSSSEVVMSVDVCEPVICPEASSANNVPSHFDSCTQRNAAIENSVDLTQINPNALNKSLAILDATRAPSEKEKTTDTYSRVSAKPKRVKSAATIQRALKVEWQIFIEVLSDVYTVTNITSQDGIVYPIICNVRNRKATTKKNLKPISVCIANIEAQLNEYKESYFNITSIDTAFSTLCSISYEIQMLTAHIELLTNIYEYKYELSSDTANIMSSCIRHYVTLLTDNVQKVLYPTEKLVCINNKLAKQIKSIAQQIEVCGSDIVAARKCLEDSVCSLQIMEESSKTEVPIIQSEIKTLETAWSTLTASISNAEAMRLANETALSTTQKEIYDLQTRQQALQSNYDLWLDEDNRTRLDLQEQIREAKAILQKTLLFKKSKQQRIDGLESALMRHLDNAKKQNTHFEVEIVNLRNASSTLNTQIRELTTIVNDAKKTVAQLHEERTQLLHSLEIKKKALLKVQNDLTEAHTTVETHQEELTKLERMLATLIQEQTQYSAELEGNKSALASLGDTLLQRIMIYPGSYSQALPYVSATATSDFAFCKQIATQFTHASEHDADILLLTNKHMHLSALYQAFLNLKNEGLIREDTDCTPLLVEIGAIDENLMCLKEEFAYCCEPFTAMNTPSVVRSTNAGFIKKANRLFETLWDHMANGTVLHSTLIRPLKDANCLQMSENNYLCFTPFYVIAMELKKNKPMAMELLRYTDINFELETPQISLPYEAACPVGATVVAEHWKYETVTGAANRRYTNNPNYLVVALNAVRLEYNKNVKTSYLLSFEESQRVVQAFCDLRNFLYEENVDLMKRFFASDQIPKVDKIVSEIVEERKKVESERKEQERRLKAQELAIKKQREEERRQKKEHQKRLEQWADSALRSKVQDDLLLAEQMNHLLPINADQIANWNDTLYQPVAVTDKRRTITNGITKIEFLYQDDAPSTSKYVVFFADENGKIFSDIRTLPSAPRGTKKIIPFEIKTQSDYSPAKLFMLIRNIEDGRLVVKTEYKLNISFTNDFEF